MIIYIYIYKDCDSISNSDLMIWLVCLFLSGVVAGDTEGGYIQGAGLRRVPFR